LANHVGFGGGVGAVVVNPSRAQSIWAVLRTMGILRKNYSMMSEIGQKEEVREVVPSALVVVT